MSRNVGNCEEKEKCDALCKFFNSKQPKPEMGLDQHMIKPLDMLSGSRDFNFDLFGRECLELHDKERAKVKQFFKRMDGNISLSVDVISSGKTDEENGSDYMCLTAHFIDDKWALRRFVLEFSPLGREGKDSLSETVLRSLREWELENKILAITIVNGSSYNEMFEAVKEKICRNLFNFRFQRVNCCADMVKTVVVQDAFESISEILDKIEDIYSSEDIFPTWENKNSHLIVAILTEQSGGFAGILYGKPSKKEWAKVSHICDLVNDVYNLVFPLFETGYQPANIFLYNLLELQLYLNHQMDDSNCFKKGVAKKMAQTLDKYVNDMYLLLATASVLDPRLKMKYINFSYFEVKGGDDSDLQMMSKVLGDIKALYNEYAACYPTKKSDPDDDTPELMKKFTQLVNSDFTSKPVESELETYLEEPVLAWSSDFNALDWWKVVGSTEYPVLSKMARDVLAIPFTISIGEDALKIEQRKVDSCLVSIEPSLAKAFMCVRSWLLNQNCLSPLSFEDRLFAGDGNASFLTI